MYKIDLSLPNLLDHGVRCHSPTLEPNNVNIGLVHYSTHMSLTLAGLCGEWQLVSRNYEAWGAIGGKYEAQIQATKGVRAYP